MAKETEFLSSFESIKTLRDDAFRSVDEAVKHEENDEPLYALQSYKKSIDIIDTALATLICVPKENKEEWSETCKIIHKMKQARLELLQRVSVLNKKHAIELDVQLEEAEAHTKKTTDFGRVQTYAEIAKGLRESKSENEIVSLKFICTNVKLNNINPSGVITTVWSDAQIGIFCIEKNEEKQLNETYFIQCIKAQGPLDDKTDFIWIYPINPSESECYRTSSSGSFIFPDLQSYEPGSVFELVIPRRENSDEIFLEILQSILYQGVKEFREGQCSLPKDVNTQISTNIVSCANFISQNLIKGAEKTGQFVSYITPSAISMMSAAPKNVAPVSQNVQMTVGVVKSVTGTAAGATGYVAGIVGNALGSFGSFLAPHIQKHGSTLVAKSFGLEESAAEEKMQGALVIAGGAVEGLGIVYSSLEESVKILGNNLSDNTVKIVEHKYGPSAGSLASETFDTVGNVIELNQNVNFLHPKRLAKRTAKCTGKAIIEDINKRGRNGSHFIPAASIYPDLKNLETLN